jgi:hypothetical protein
VIIYPISLEIMNKFVSGKGSILALTTVFAVASFLLGKYLTTTLAADKITICHAAGQEGTTHFNTLNLSPSAVYANSQGNGGHFTADGTPAAGHEDDYFGACTNSTPPPTDFDACPNIEGNQASVPEGMDLDEEGNCVTPPPGESPYCLNGETIWVSDEEDPPEGATLGSCRIEPTPDNDVCDNIDGVQTSVPEGLHLDGGGINCVSFSNPGTPENPSGPQGQVLGATTMAGAGSFAEDAYLAIMLLGGTLSGFGIKKAFRRA